MGWESVEPGGCVKDLHVATADNCALVMGSLVLCTGCDWLPSKELSSRLGWSGSKLVSRCGRAGPKSINMEYGKVCCSIVEMLPSSSGKKLTGLTLFCLKKKHSIGTAIWRWPNWMGVRA